MREKRESEESQGRWVGSERILALLSSPSFLFFGESVFFLSCRNQHRRAGWRSCSVAAGFNPHGLFSSLRRFFIFLSRFNFILLFHPSISSAKETVRPR